MVRVRNNVGAYLHVGRFSHVYAQSLVHRPCHSDSLRRALAPSQRKGAVRGCTDTNLPGAALPDRPTWPVIARAAKCRR